MAIYRDVCRCMTTADDFERVIVEHARAMAAQQIAYAELSINPSLHPGEGWVDGMVRARRRVVDEFGMEIAWLVELVRGESMEDNERAFEIALATEGVVGLGLVGDESIPASPLLPLVRRARSGGLRFMPHAGQVGGASVVRGAGGGPHAGRIAPGGFPVDGPSLLSGLALRGILLFLCP